jgi:Cytidine deaminase
MNEKFKNLYETAKNFSEKKILTEYAHYGKVACALETEKGSIYTGISLVADCGGFCAENAAILEMLKNNESKIVRIIAVADSEVRPPCGKCRDLIRMINVNNLNTLVMINESEVLTIKELLPYYWEH